jgi:hypothetical protein
MLRHHYSVFARPAVYMGHRVLFPDFYMNIAVVSDVAFSTL